MRVEPTFYDQRVGLTDHALERFAERVRPVARHASYLRFALRELALADGRFAKSIAGGCSVMALCSLAALRYTTIGAYARATREKTYLAWKATRLESCRGQTSRS